MALVARGGSTFRLGRSLLWSASWGLGAAIGVALGGWLTLVGGAGAPGIESLDPWTDLAVLPFVAFVAVAAVHLVAQVLFAILRGRRSNDDGEGDRERPRSEGDQVTR